MRLYILILIMFITLFASAQSVSVDCGKYTGTKTHTISVNSKDIKGLNAMQFTVDYNPNVLKFAGIDTKKSILPKLAKTNFNANNKGKIAFVWFDVTSLTASKGELFKINFEVLSKKISTINIDGSLTDVDASTDNGSVKLNLSGCTLKLK